MGLQRPPSPRPTPDATIPAMSSSATELSTAELLRAVEILETLVADPSQLAGLKPDDVVRLMAAAGHVSAPPTAERRPVSRAVRRERKKRDVMADRALSATVGIRKVRQAEVFVAPPKLLPAPEGEAESYRKARSCYVCKQPFTKLHSFYDGMCPECGDFNYARRFQETDLSGRAAYITGARLKIGFQAALKMLRSGARGEAMRWGLQRFAGLRPDIFVKFEPTGDLIDTLAI